MKLRDIINRFLIESKKDKILALSYVKDENVLKEIASVIKPKDKNIIDKLLVLGAYYYANNSLSIDQIKKDMTDYINLLNDKKVKLIEIEKSSNKPSLDYIAWTEVIHGHMAEKKKKEQSRKFFDEYDEEPIAVSQNGMIKVYESNSAAQCIKLGRGHTFCISQPGNTMWHSYRASRGSTFYFVKDSSRDDRLSTVVIDADESNIVLTDVVNQTGSTLDPVSGDITTSHWPYFYYLERNGIDTNIFKNIPFSDEERAEQEKLGRPNNNLNWFISLTHEEKSKYISRGHVLTNEQFDFLWNNNLKLLLTQYVKTGIPIRDYQVAIVATNSDLRKNYLHNRVIATDIDAAHGYGLTKLEYSLLSEKDRLNLIKTSNGVSVIMLHCEDKDSEALKIIDMKEKLTSNDVKALIKFSNDKKMIVQKLNSKYINIFDYVLTVDDRGEMIPTDEELFEYFNLQPQLSKENFIVLMDAYRYINDYHYEKGCIHFGKHAVEANPNNLDAINEALMHTIMSYKLYHVEYSNAIARDVEILIYMGANNFREALQYIRKKILPMPGIGWQMTVHLRDVTKILMSKIQEREKLKPAEEIQMRYDRLPTRSKRR